MLSPEIRILARHCVSLRRSKDALGQQLDRLDVGSAEYATVDAKYQKLFDQFWDARDAIVAAPVTSKCDIIAKTKIMADDAAEFEIEPDIALLHRQVREWKRVGPVEWP